MSSSLAEVLNIPESAETFQVRSLVLNSEEIEYLREKQAFTAKPQTALIMAFNDISTNRELTRYMDNLRKFRKCSGEMFAIGATGCLLDNVSSSEPPAAEVVLEEV